MFEVGFMSDLYADLAILGMFPAITLSQLVNLFSFSFYIYLHSI